MGTAEAFCVGLISSPTAKIGSYNVKVANGLFYLIVMSTGWREIRVKPAQIQTLTRSHSQTGSCDDWVVEDRLVCFIL